MISQILFDLPARFLPGLASGEIVRYGAILKDAVTGRIVGHVQESGIAQSLLSQVLTTAPTPLTLVSNLANAGTGIYTAVQVRQLKAMVESLQALQIATLGVSLAGIGVSVAGFLYMRNRFNKLDARLDKLLDAVNTGFDNVEKSGLRHHMSKTKSLVQRAELAKSMTVPRQEYMEVAAQLADQAAYFEGEILFHTAASGPVNHDTFWVLAQLLMLCNSVRIDCQIRADELHNAQLVSERIASEYQALFEPLGPGSFNVSAETGRSTIRTLRDATDSAHSKRFLLDYLRTLRIDGPGYIESLEREKEQSILMLSTS